MGRWWQERCQVYALKSSATPCTARHTTGRTVRSFPSKMYSESNPCVNPMKRQGHGGRFQKVPESPAW